MATKASHFQDFAAHVIAGAHSPLTVAQISHAFKMAGNDVPEDADKQLKADARLALAENDAGEAAFGLKPEEPAPKAKAPAPAAGDATKV